MTKGSIPQPQDKYVLRLPDGMRARIKCAAAENGRSMNAEILHTLDRAYPDLRQSRLLEAAKCARFVLGIVHAREPGTNEAGAIAALDAAIASAEGRS